MSTVSKRPSSPKEDSPSKKRNTTAPQYPDLTVSSLSYYGDSQKFSVDGELCDEYVGQFKETRTLFRFTRFDSETNLAEYTPAVDPFEFKYQRNVLLGHTGDEYCVHFDADVDPFLRLSINRKKSLDRRVLYWPGWPRSCYEYSIPQGKRQGRSTILFYPTGSFRRFATSGNVL
ncbi:hypothetical protein BT96DRAFT_528089 [Gymnopus androsaceus JB14]|uniref:Uncharacterized protein n=1 Tax=Gymnopus androsaceus JB14 TaxID=1447944 RepID=A0A6A4IG44_9AGAR|nr:hypothetical protein BT96DRAFT_528089 [Gymnopus androsaceus JB14]